jgi:Leucine-rich repeat (LRR) protein
MNQLTSLPDLSANTKLKSLSCFVNQLDSVPDLSANTVLESLSCSDNQLTSLPDLSANAALEGLSCSDNQLTSLPDLSANTALTSLSCDDNQLNSIPDLSANTALTKFDCSHNPLTNLPDLSANIALEELTCDSIQLTSLPNLSANTALTSLSCDDNELTSLPDLSANTELYRLSCSGNLFDSLDLSGYSGLTRIYLSDMPSLGEVCVWELPFPPADVTVDTTNSPNVNFTDACIVSGSNPHKLNNKIEIYPNPNKGSFIIEIEHIQPVNAELRIVNSLGQQVLVEQIKQAEGKYTRQFDLREYPAGIYYVQIEGINGVINKQIIIE